MWKKDKEEAKMKSRLKLGFLCVLLLLGFLWAASPDYGRKEAGDL